MAQAKCPQCGAGLDPTASACKYCGEPLIAAQPVRQYGNQVTPQPHPQSQPYHINQQAQQAVSSPYDPSWPIKSKIVAGVLAILLGGLGIHKFYMGRIGLGVLYLIFCWTCIPSIIGVVEGIVYLVSSDHNFQVSHHVRLQ